MSTVVTHQSWFGRIRESFKSFVIGLAMFIAAFPILFFNEGRAVRTEKSLEEGQGAVISVSADAVNPANEKKLVHLSGAATTTETLADAEFGVSANAIKLRRNVEMYQWKEKEETKTEKKTGGGSTTTTTYTYSKEWLDAPVSSAAFHEAEGHQNPESFPFEAKEEVAQAVTLGAFQLTPSLVGQMDDYQPVNVADHAATLPEPLKQTMKVENGAYYLGADPKAPQVGDVRISFAAVPPGSVSVVSKQVGNTFEAYRADAGMDIEMLRRGVHTAQSMFQAALAANTMLTWILRGVGLFLMFLGLVMVFRPLSVLGDVIPMIGSMLAFGTGLFALVISFSLSIGTIAVAWVIYRPVLGITLLSVAIAVLVTLAIRGKKKVASNAATAAPATA
jgi:hypothetical protein